MKSVKFVVLLFSLMVYSSTNILVSQRSLSADTLVIDTTRHGPKLRSSFFENEVRTPTVLMPSPQTQLFEKYLNHSINESNGLIDLSIPLYEIEIKGLKIPIVLSYNSSGIKHGQHDGDVGAGWSINAGGYRVSRTIYGRPDETYPFFDLQEYFGYTAEEREGADSYLAAVGGVFEEATFLRKSQYREYELQDGEYDQFNYMLPSTAGKFIITDRNSMQTAIIGHSADQITFETKVSRPEKRITGISIKDMSGFHYHFGGDESLIEGSGGHGYLYAHTAWALKEIVSPYKERINFEYVSCQAGKAWYDNYPTSLVAKEVHHYLDGGSVADLNCTFGEIADFDTDVSISIGYMTFFVSKIETEKEIIEFVRSPETSSDPAIRAYHLRKVIIKDKLTNKTIKQLTFNYYPTNSQKRWHCLLASIQIGSDSNMEKTYSFDYYQPNESNLGYRNYFPDQWGYYSEIDRNIYSSFLMGMGLHEDFKKDRIITNRENTLKSTSLELLVSPNYFIWKDRKMNKGLHHLFSLKKITFPTGGSSEYKYESNKYLDKFGTILTGGGQRIERIISKQKADAAPHTTWYKYGKDENGVGKANIDIDENFFRKEDILYYRKDYEATECTGWYYYLNRTYLMNPIIPETSYFSVSYSQVTSYPYGNNQYNGRIVSAYEIPNQYEGFFHFDFNDRYLMKHLYLNGKGYYYIGSYNLGLNTYLTKRITFNNKQDTVRAEVFNYQENNKDSIYEGVQVKQIKFLGDLGYNPLNPNCYPLNLYEKHLFCHSRYLYNMRQNNLLDSKITTTYSAGEKIAEKEAYEYNNKQQVIKVTTTSSAEDKQQVILYTYPQNHVHRSNIYREMADENILSPVIEKTIKIDNVETGKIITNYKKVNQSIYLPASIQTVLKNVTQTDIVYDKYDDQGNILQYTPLHETPVCYIWSYNQQYPIAEIRNASYDQIEKFLNEVDLKALAKKSNPSDSDFKRISSLKKQLPYSHISIYTYYPLIGIKSETDPSGKTLYYTYDEFNRLKESYSIENGIKKLEQSYSYHYRDQ